jgi:Ca-activated chloride channel family protein
MTPTVASYYNSAVAYYRAKKYKKAMEIFTQIETPNPDIKQKIYYNMGNCAVKLKKYKRAKIYYQKALALGDDKDAYHNLLLLYKLKLKEGVDISDMLPKNQVNKQTGASKKEQIKKSSQQNSSKSQQKASQKSSGSGSKSSGQDKKELQQTQQQNKAQYKIGYRAYELINKGYTNEKHPW